MVCIKFSKGKSEFFNFALLFKAVLIFQSPLQFHMNFKINIFLLKKEELHEYIDFFETYFILNSIKSSSPWTLVVFPFTYEFLNFLAAKFYSSCTCFIQLICKYFFFFDVIENIIISISFSDFSFLVCRATTSFHILILFSATLLNFLVAQIVFSWIL